MKVSIGPYTDWFGPYQIADAVFFWLEKYPEDEVAERRIYKLHDWLGDFLSGGKNQDSWLSQFCSYIHSKKKRKIKIKIDHYDIWNASHTMAIIMVPLLKELQKHKHGSPDVDPGDVPENIWPKQLASSANGYVDDTVHERWQWTLGEMIWALEQIADDDAEAQFYDHTGANDPKDDLMTQAGKIKIDQEGLEAWQERKRNGLRLLGKYFEGLWD